MTLHNSSARTAKATMSIGIETIKLKNTVRRFGVSELSMFRRSGKPEEVIERFTLGHLDRPLALEGGLGV